MKFIVSSQQLSKSLQSISGVITTNSTVPIIQNFLFIITGDTLSVSATDLETTMTTSLLLSKSEKDGSIVVQSKLLMDTIKNLPDIPIIFNIDQEKYTVEIVANEGSYNLACFNADDFPMQKNMENANFVELPSSLVKTAISKTLFATGNDEMRIAMTGVFCDLSAENVTFVATDAHKLVRYRRSDVNSSSSFSFILPKKPLIQLKNNVVDDDSNVRIEYNDVNVRFIFSNYVLTARLIDGKYPNYEAVIPTNNPNVLYIERVSFLNSLRRVSIYSNPSVMQVRLKLSLNSVVLTAEDPELSNLAIEKLNCNYNGDDMEIGFNAKFLQEMLGNIETPEVKLEMSQSNRAGILYPVDNANVNEEILMLVMPVMLNN
ncbi:MAG: DNA polymerase III subunit beta [Bacteroidota bacterium]